MRIRRSCPISYSLPVAALLGIVPLVAAASEPGQVITFRYSVVMQAEAAEINPGRAEIVAQDSFRGRQGVALRSGLPTNVGAPETNPDLVFRVRASKPGRYVIRTHAATDAKGTELMRRTHSKHGSLRLMIAVGACRPTRRVVYVPWSRPESCRQTTGKFDLDACAQEIRIWLPEGVRLDELAVSRYVPPKVPAATAAYRPTIVPPASRPRIWVNAQSLARVRANLTKGANAPCWDQVQELAAKPVAFKAKLNMETNYDAGLERAVVAKAFVYLMTRDKQRGREAVTVTSQYLAAVEFGNLLDITREGLVLRFAIGAISKTLGHRADTHFSRRS